MHDKIYDFIHKTYISKQQFGFMKHQSTLKQLLIFLFLMCPSPKLQSITCQTDILYLDIQKVFDCVPQLLVKLSEAGIAGKLWKFLYSVMKEKMVPQTKTTYKNLSPLQLSVPASDCLTHGCFPVSPICKYFCSLWIVKFYILSKRVIIIHIASKPELNLKKVLAKRIFLTKSG